MQREIDKNDILLLKALNEVLENIGLGAINGYLGRIEAISNSLLDKNINDNARENSRCELSNIFHQIKKYRDGCLTLRLDNLIKKLEVENKSWFNYYLNRQQDE